MSRYCGDRDSKATLEAADHWRQKTLLADGSIFTEKSIWKLEHFQALDKYFIQQPDDRERSFFEKLADQLPWGAIKFQRPSRFVTEMTRE